MRQAFTEYRDYRDRDDTMDDEDDPGEDLYEEEEFYYTPDDRAPSLSKAPPRSCLRKIERPGLGRKENYRFF